MTSKKISQKMPRSRGSLRVKKAVKKLREMAPSDRVQLLVRAKLLTQDEADIAKTKLSESAK